MEADMQSASRMLVVALALASFSGSAGAEEQASKVPETALPRESAIEEPARALLSSHPRPDPEAWRAAAARTADRAGLVLCGDVATALDMLLGDGARAMGRAEAIAQAAGRADVQALLAFAASDAHFTLRQRMRIAIA